MQKQQKGATMPAHKKLKPRPPTLKRPTMADLNDLHVMLADPRVWWNQVGYVHDDIIHTRTVLRQWIREWKYEAIGIWIARDAQGRFVGVGGIRRCGNAWSLRYCVLPDCWHNGYGTYLATAGMKAATYFDKEIPVFLTTLRANFTSCLIADKLRFVRVRNDFDPRSEAAARRIYADRPVSEQEIREYLDARTALLW